MAVLDDFEVVLRQRDGIFVAGIPELALFAKGSNSQAALEALEAKKRDLSEALLDVGELDRYAKTSRQPQITVVNGTNLLQFLARSAIVALMIFLTMSAGGAVILSLTEFRLVRSIERAVARGADPKNELSAERRQELLANFEIIVDRWAPILQEAERILATKGIGAGTSN